MELCAFSEVRSFPHVRTVQERSVVLLEHHVMKGVQSQCITWYVASLEQPFCRIFAGHPTIMYPCCGQDASLIGAEGKGVLVTPGFRAGLLLMLFHPNCGPSMTWPKCTLQIEDIRGSCVPTSALCYPCCKDQGPVHAREIQWLGPLVFIDLANQQTASQHAFALTIGLDGA